MDKTEPYKTIYWEYIKQIFGVLLNDDPVMGIGYLDAWSAVKDLTKFCFTFLLWIFIDISSPLKSIYFTITHY